MELSEKQTNELIQTLKQRFEKNMHLHKNIDWHEVEKKLLLNPQKLWSLNEMDATGGEPDVVGYDNKTNEYIFYDCSQDSPKGRRSLCYDNEALEKRKEFKPKDSAINMAKSMGVEILSEEEYRSLQKLAHFDTKTQNWIKTPSEIRDLGGAIFADRRYNTVFIYHNGAESYYAIRGFRSSLKV